MKNTTKPKRSRKKLVLNVDSVRDLQPSDLSEVQGGNCLHSSPSIGGNTGATSTQCI